MIRTADVLAILYTANWFRASSLFFNVAVVDVAVALKEREAIREAMMTAV